jgi:hypothetical protein
MDQTQMKETTMRWPLALTTGEDLVARGFDLAQAAVDELIDELWRRAVNHQLDRGVRLSLPYYDDRQLSLRWRDFTVIPRGRILFVPAFVVVAAEREIQRVRKDRQFTDSTRQHLIGLLEKLRLAFAQPAR